MENKRDLQVFQVSGIGKIEDNLTSADPLSYTTTIVIPGRPGKLSQRSLDLQKPIKRHQFIFIFITWREPLSSVYIALITQLICQCKKVGSSCLEKANLAYVYYQYCTSICRLRSFTVSPMKNSLRRFSKLNKLSPSVDMMSEKYHKVCCTCV